jgi:hypothetical protein
MIKDEILLLAREADVCGAYQDIMIADTEEQIIQAGLPLLEWAYRTGILTDSILNQFDKSLLNANGIYRTGSHVLKNPLLDIYCLGDSSVEIFLTGNSKCNVFSTSSLVLNLSGNAFVKTKIFSGALSLEQNQNSLSCNELTGGNHNINTKDETVCHIKVYENTQLTLQTNNNSYNKLQGFYNSITTGYENSSIPVDVMLSQKAIYQYGLQ